MAILLLPVQHGPLPAERHPDVPDKLLHVLRPANQVKVGEDDAGVSEEVLVDLRLPLDDASATAAADACTAACERWLDWMLTAEDNKRGLPAGMRQTATYTRDTKVRSNHFGFLLGKYSKLFGAAEGKALAEADAGPLDEAYVGGGS